MKSTLSLLTLIAITFIPGQHLTDIETTNTTHKEMSSLQILETLHVGSVVELPWTDCWQQLCETGGSRLFPTA